VLAPIVEKSEAGEAAGGLSGGDWEALVVNSRGCAGSKITTGLMYNARATVSKLMRKILSISEISANPSASHF
jgi:predicted alpha/beta-fold hydrolase